MAKLENDPNADGIVPCNWIMHLYLDLYLYLCDGCRDVMSMHPSIGREVQYCNRAHDILSRIPGQVHADAKERKKVE